MYTQSSCHFHPHHPRCHYLRLKFTDTLRRYRLGLQHWVNVHQQPVFHGGITFYPTIVHYVCPMVTSREVHSSSFHHLGIKTPYNEPRVRVLDPILLVCDALHKDLDRSNESVEFDLPF